MQTFLQNHPCDVFIKQPKMSLMELKASEIDDTIHPEQRCRKQSIAPSPSENNNGATVKQPPSSQVTASVK